MWKSYRTLFYQVLLVIIISLAAFLRVYHAFEVFDAVELHNADGVYVLKEGLLNYFFTFPILYHHAGPLYYLLQIPFFYFLGQSIIALKLSFIVFGILSVFFLYLFVKDFYTEEEALLASFILAILPSHVLLSTITLIYIYPSFFVCITLFLFYRYYKTGKNAYLYLGAAIAGLGIMVRISFIFFLIPFVLLVFLFKGWPFVKKSFKKLVVALVFFILGGGYPLIFLNFDENFKATESWVKDILVYGTTTSSGENIRDVWGNLKKGFLQKFSMFLKEYKHFTTGDLPYESVKIFNFLDIFLFTLAITIFVSILNLYSHLRHHSHKSIHMFKKDIFILICLFFILILTSTITVGVFHVEEYVITSPFIAIIIGKGIYEILTISKKFPIFFLGFLFLCVVIILTTYEFYRSYSLRSPSICVVHLPDLAKIINEMNYSFVRSDHVIFHDALFWYGVKEEGGGFIFVEERGKFILDPYINKILKEPSPDESILFVFQPPECAAKQNFREIFKEEVEKNNKEIIEERNITFGELTYTIYRIGSKK